MRDRGGSFLWDEDVCKTNKRKTMNLDGPWRPGIDDKAGDQGNEYSESPTKYPYDLTIAWKMVLLADGLVEGRNQSGQDAILSYC